MKTDPVLVLFGFFGAMALSFVTVLFQGYLLSIAWSWVMVRFFDLPQLGVAACIAITAFIGFFKAIPDTKKKSFGESMLDYLAIILKDLFCLGFIWLACQFV